MVRIKLNSKIPIGELKILENKLLMFDRNTSILIFTDVNIEIEYKDHGRKKNKSRKITYLSCKLYGYNANDDITFEHDEGFVRMVLTLFNISEMRKNYLDHLKELNAMQELEKNLNEPSYVDNKFAYIENVLAFLKQDKLLSATKEYKTATGKSLQESKNDVLEIFEKHYPEQYKKFMS